MYLSILLFLWVYPAELHHLPPTTARGAILQGNPKAHQNIYPKIDLVNTCQDTPKNHLKAILGVYLLEVYSCLVIVKNDEIGANKSCNKHAITRQLLGNEQTKNMQ